MKKFEISLVPYSFSPIPIDMDPSTKKKLEIKENQDQGGVYIKDCIIKIAHAPSDLEKALKDGNKNKSMGETQMNRDSSRSHCVFTIYVETSEMLPVT